MANIAKGNIQLIALLRANLAASSALLATLLGSGGGVTFVSPMDPPVLTKTSASGASPFTFDEAIPSNVYAGFGRQIQTDDDPAFGSPAQDLYNMVTEGQLATGIVDWSLPSDSPPRRIADNVLEALALDWAGLRYLRIRYFYDVDNGDGTLTRVYSDWSDVLNDTLPSHILFPSATGADKAASLVVAADRLTVTGDPNRGVFDGARASGNGVTAKVAYEVTVDIVPPDNAKPLALAFEYQVGGVYADLSGGGDATEPGAGTVAGFYFNLLKDGIYNPSLGFIANAVNVGDTYHVKLDPAAGTAALYRMRSGAETLIGSLSGLPTGKTWRAVGGAGGTGGVAAKGTYNFGNPATPFARTPDTGYSKYEALAA